jgi:hypothetical protein
MYQLTQERAQPYTDRPMDTHFNPPALERIRAEHNSIFGTDLSQEELIILKAWTSSTSYPTTSPSSKRRRAFRPPRAHSASTTQQEAPDFSLTHNDQQYLSGDWIVCLLSKLLHRDLLCWPQTRHLPPSTPAQPRTNRPSPLPYPRHPPTLCTRPTYSHRSGIARAGHQIRADCANFEKSPPLLRSVIASKGPRGRELLTARLRISHCMPWIGLLMGIRAGSRRWSVR